MFDVVLGERCKNPVTTCVETNLIWSQGLWPVCADCAAWVKASIDPKPTCRWCIRYCIIIVRHQESTSMYCTLQRHGR